MNHKRNVTFLLLICFIAASMVIVIPVRAGTAYYVNGTTGNNVPWPAAGSLANPWKTIQYAINDPIVVAGDTIKVAQATYAESITINKGLTITGDPGDASPGPGANAPILDGTTLGGGVPAVTIAQGVSNVVFEGFEIRNYGPNGNTNADGVSVWNSGTFNVQIRDNYIHHVGYDGVLTGNGWGGPQGLHSGWIITRNIIKNFGAYAIDLENAKDSQITNNKISNPTFTTTYGIVIAALGCDANTIDMSNVTVSSNQIENYPDRAMTVMAWTAAAGATATLRNVIVSGNNITGSFNAILAWKTGPGTNTLKDITITSNTITINNPKASNYIVDLSDVGGTNSFDSNTITLTGAIGGGGTWFHGVNIGGSSTGTWTIEHNKLNGNNVGADSVGFRIRGTLPATAILRMRCNDITEFAMGIRSDALASGVQVKVDCCNIYGNSQYGINNGAGAMINAENNWWGTVTGPTHPSNPGGTGDSVSDNVDFDPWLRFKACGPPPVGGEWVPINKLQLLTPWITLASLVAATTVTIGYVKHRKKKHD